MNIEPVSYEKIQELVMQVPSNKLPILYHILVRVIADKENHSSLQEKFMFMPIAERQKIMEQQAEQMITHYNKTALERQEWQHCDFIEY